MKLTCVIENSSMPLGFTSNGAVPFGLLDHKYVQCVCNGVRDHQKRTFNYSGSSAQGTHWGKYKFTCFVLCREVVLFSEVGNVLKL